MSERRKGGDDTKSAIKRFIVVHEDEMGFPPTLRDIARHVGLSTASAVYYHLRVMEADGEVRRLPGLSRTIRLTADAEAQVRRGMR